jgi:hypothetical protein
MNKQQIISKIPWSDRLCYHAGLDEFVEEPEDEYDLSFQPSILYRRLQNG